MIPGVSEPPGDGARRRARQHPEPPGGESVFGEELIEGALHIRLPQVLALDIEPEAGMGLVGCHHRETVLDQKAHPRHARVRAAPVT